MYPAYFGKKNIVLAHLEPEIVMVPEIPSLGLIAVIRENDVSRGRSGPRAFLKCSIDSLLFISYMCFSYSKPIEPILKSEI